MGLSISCDSSVTNLGFDRFADHLDKAAEETMKDLVRLGSETAKALAPRGRARGDYGRRPKTSSNIKVTYVSPKTGLYSISAVNAMSQEFGAAPHEISGHPLLKFYWEREGKFVQASSVNHPGNSSQAFMRPSYKIVVANAERIMLKNYGG
jgi:hypothetical protein